MSRFSIQRHSGVLALVLLLAPAAARADEPHTDAPEIASDWACVAADELAELRGGLNVQRSAVLGNQVGSGSRTGEVRVTDNAFAGTRGITSTIINTGNNVAIQSTLNVVIDLH